MGRNSGSHLKDCNVCGRTYTSTNFMTRIAVTPNGRMLRTDVHQAKCNGWTVFLTKDSEEARFFSKGDITVNCDQHGNEDWKLCFLMPNGSHVRVEDCTCGEMAGCEIHDDIKATIRRLSTVFAHDAAR